MAAHMSLKLDEKQRVLEIPDVQQRLEHLPSPRGLLPLFDFRNGSRGRIEKLHDFLGVFKVPGTACRFTGPQFATGSFLRSRRLRSLRFHDLRDDR